MSEPLDVLPVPCGSCPYLRTTPPGVWDASEYEKLPGYANDRGGIPSLGIFLCHQTRATVCRGWLTVEAETVAVRLALCRGRIRPEDVVPSVEVPLYATGAEAAAAGLAGVERPSRKACRVIERLSACRPPGREEA